MQKVTSAADEWKAGWPLPVVAAMAYALAGTHIASLGMFFEPLEREFGWSRSQISSGGLVFSLVSVVAIPLIGRLVDLKGARRIALPGAVFYCCVLAALGLAHSAVWSWWALWAVIALAMAFISPAVLVSAVSSRFDKGRGLAIATALSGAGVGMAVAPPLANWFIEAYNWRLAYIGMGAVYCAVVFPLLFCFFFSATDLHERPKQKLAAEPTPALVGMSVRDGLRNFKFQRLLVAGFLAVLALYALVVHFIPVLTNSGIPATQAANAAGLIGVGSIAGRIVTGVLLDRIHGKIVGCFAFSLPILVSLSLWEWGSNSYMIIPTAFLLGFPLGSEVDVLAYLTSRYIGLKNFGSLFGAIVAASILAVGVGPWIGGVVYDQFDSYQYLLIGTIPVFLLAAAILASLGPYPEDNEVLSSVN